MMLDIKVKDGKLVFAGGDLVLIDGAESVRQQLEFRLSLWRGEWFLNTDFGTPYRDNILGKALTVDGAVAAIRMEIMQVEGVDAITQLDYDYDRKSRKLSINFQCATSYGLVSYEV